MKNLICLLACALVCSAARAEYDSVTIRTAAALTPTNSVVLTNAIPVTGKIVALTAAAAGGSVTARVYTVSANGSSHTAARTIQSATVAPVGGYETNYAANVFLAGDNLVARFDNAAITSSVTAVVTVIYER